MLTILFSSPVYIATASTLEMLWLFAAGAFIVIGVMTRRGEELEGQQNSVWLKRRTQAVWSWERGEGLLWLWSDYLSSTQPVLFVFVSLVVQWRLLSTRHSCISQSLSFPIDSEWANSVQTYRKKYLTFTQHDFDVKRVDQVGLRGKGGVGKRSFGLWTGYSGSWAFWFTTDTRERTVAALPNALVMLWHDWWKWWW